MTLAQEAREQGNVLVGCDGSILDCMACGYKRCYIEASREEIEAAGPGDGLFERLHGNR